MNTLDIGDILEEWNLSHLYTKFKDERITIEVLKILTPIHIAKLFSDLPVGDQAIFETNLKKWMQSLETSDVDLSTSTNVTQKIICSEFYTNGKRGKIYNKLANHKRVAKDTFKCKNQIPDKIENDVEDNYGLILMYLRDEKTTAEDFCLYWKQCAPLSEQT
ncbi:hypothetical protein CVS40_3410 [Lucilia cuprina]|nr:hypothetical protein CVS40_3410 [Lucilia cuprina]KAI8126857.1 hypothetical protein CVS40_3410 [Lucilia cuprina]